MPTPVPEFHDVDRARFEGEVIPAARPAILRGLVSSWPAVVAARQSSASFADYLRGQASNAPGEAWFGAPEIGGRFNFNEALDGYNHDRKLASIAQLLDLLLRQSGDGAPWSIFAGALPLRRHLPRWADAQPMPLLDAGRPMLTSLWLGNATRTAAHWDLPQNLACVVAGQRRFTLFPTDQVANLYVGPVDFTLAGQPSSMVDIDAPDLARFPRFADALAVAQVAELEPGDALYMPSLWWHAVQSSGDVCAMINYWWRDAPADAVSPMRALMLAITTLQGMPPAEVARWRTLFDHYVWSGDDPVPHLPEKRRGVLGPRDPAKIAEIHAMIADALTR